MKPKAKSKWSPAKKNKAAVTTKRTRLENKAAKIKTQTRRKPFIRAFAPYARLAYKTGS